MIRKMLLPGLALFAGLTASAQRTVLENEFIRAEFNDRNGALVSLVNKESGWNVIPRAELGQSFRMLVPIDGPEYKIEDEIRFNNAYGTEQKSAPAVDRSDNSVTFRWNAISSEFRDNLDIAFSATATLTEDGLVFSGELENHSGFVVEYVAWPYFGEVAVPDKSERFLLETRDFTRELYPIFPSEKGYWGVDYPTNVTVLPHDGFFLLRNSSQGMLVSELKPSDNELLIGMYDIVPGFDKPGRWAETDKLDGIDARMRASFSHVVYLADGEKCRINPTLVSLYSGDWRKGLEPYRNNVGKPHSSDNWASDVKAWRKVSISAAEDIIGYASDCVENGVSVLVVRNWHRCVPYSLMESLPDLARCIREAHKIGCRVVLETEFWKTDPLGPKYGELRNYLQKDPAGVPYDGTRMCTMHPKLNELVRTDYPVVYKKLGADALICADQQFRMQTAICYDKGHSHKAPKFIGSGISSLNRQFAEDARRYDRNFLVGGITAMDAEADIFDFMFLNGCPRSQALRYLHPSANIIATINPKYAREDINTCVLNRFTVCYNDLAGARLVSGLPNVAAYAQAVEALRTEFKDYIWDADIVSPDEVAVKADGLSYSVFRSRSTGKFAVVLANYAAEGSRNAVIELPHAVKVTPENLTPAPCSGKLDIAPLSLAVVIEK